MCSGNTLSCVVHPKVHKILVSFLFSFSKQKAHHLHLQMGVSSDLC